jgi:hypothetical protein
MGLLLALSEIPRFAQNDIVSCFNFHLYYPHAGISLKESFRWGGGKYFTITPQLFRKFVLYSRYAHYSLF